MATALKYSGCPTIIPSTGVVNSFPKCSGLTLAGVRIVSFVFWPVRALSLWKVVTLTCAIASSAHNRASATIEIVVRIRPFGKGGDSLVKILQQPAPAPFENQRFHASLVRGWPELGKGLPGLIFPPAIQVIQHDGKDPTRGPKLILEHLLVIVRLSKFLEGLGSQLGAGPADLLVILLRKLRADVDQFVAFHLQDQPRHYR